MLDRLAPRSSEGVRWFEDERLRRQAGILVAYSERVGGVSQGVYESLNLAGHVGDVPEHVNENRRRVLAALDADLRPDRLVLAEQVHGDEVGWVAAGDAGRGAVVNVGAEPVPGCDALATAEVRLPLMLLFADCVPVIIADPIARVVAVVHAGWRGALAGLPGKTIRELASRGSTVGDLAVYIGPHICGRHYEVGNELLTTFLGRFGTVCAAEAGHLDLGAVVSADLTSSGVRVENISRLGVCTSEATDRFYSYRASSGPTGRHAAIAALLR